MSDPRREYRAALVLVALGAGLALLGFGRTWATAVTGQEGLPRVVVTVSGTDLVPFGAAVPLVALAGVAGLVATRGPGRRAVGVLLLLSGGAGALLAARAGVSLHDASGAGGAVDRIVSERTGVLVAGVPVSTTSWWVAAALGSVLVAAGGLLALLRGGRWPALGRRYERTGSAATGPQDREESAWDLLDQGLDPTLGDDPGPGGGTAARAAGPADLAGDDPMLGRGPGS